MELTAHTYLLVGLVAFAAQVLGGISGYGTGLLMPLVLVPLIGAEATVPVIALASMLTNPIRVWTFWDKLDGALALRVTALALPGVALGAYGFTLLSGFWAQLLIGTMLMLLAPLGRWLRGRRFRLSETGFRLGCAGAGVAMGGTSGSGIILLSVLMARGMVGAAVIATDAAASTLLGVVKLGVFIGAGALPQALLLLALVIGAMAVPGARLGKWMLLRFPVPVQTGVMDAAVFTGGAVMVWRAIV